MFRFISFGSGSSGNCYFVSNEEGGLFIDVGIGLKTLKRHSKATDVDISRAKYILVTHDHADHVKSVGRLSDAMNLEVYATRKVHDHIDQNFVVHHKVSHSLRRYFDIGERFRLLGMDITTIPVPHDSAENVGYRIEYGGVVLALITDIGHVTPEIERLIADANYLVIEANHEVEMLRNGTYPDFLKQRILSSVGHLSNKDCGLTLAKCATEKLHHVWLCHLSDDNNTPDLARYTVEGVLRDHGILAGKDFALDILKRKTPSAVADLL